MTVPILPSLIFPFNLLPTQVNLTDFSFCCFRGILAVFILSWNSNNQSYIFSKTERSRFVLVEGRFLRANFIKCWKIFHSKYGICSKEIFVLVAIFLKSLMIVFQWIVCGGNFLYKSYIYLEFLTRRCCCSWNSGEF